MASNGNRKRNESAAKSAKTLVLDRFNRARDYRITTQDDVWKRSYNNWRGIIDQSLYPWRSKLFIPWSFTVVETIIPRVFARDPRWRAVARTPDFPGDGPQTVTDLLTYQWNRMGMRLKMYDYIKDSLMYSKAFAKVTWRYKRKTKKIMEPIVGEDDKITFEQKVRNDVEYDDPMVEIVDPADIYVDPDATTSGYMGDGHYLIHRKTVPLESLKENPNYENVDQIKQSSYADEYMDKLMRYDNATPQRDKHSNLVEILEYWECDRLVVIANRNIILRDSPNPYYHKQIPFVELDDYRDPHRLYGQSELSVIDPLQREINSIRNQRRDYDNLQLNPVIRMVPGALRNPNSAVMAPGNVWMVSDLKSMDTFTLPALQGNSTEIENLTAQNIKMTTAIDEIGIGLLPDNPQRRSATEVVTSQQSAGKRFSMKIALLEEAVKNIGQLVYALDQQFLDQERIIQVVGEKGAEEWVKLSPEDVRANYHIDIETGSMLPKDEVAQRKEAVELLQYITPIISPIVGSNPEVVMPVLRMILSTYELPGINDVMSQLQKVLLGASQNAQAKAQSDAEMQQAQAANQQAQAIGALQQGSPEITAPQTGSQQEAQAALDAAAAAGQ